MNMKGKEQKCNEMKKKKITEICNQNEAFCETKLEISRHGNDLRKFHVSNSAGNFWTVIFDPFFEMVFRMEDYKIIKYLPKKATHQWKT